MEENLLNMNESGKCTSCKKKGRGRPKGSLNKKTIEKQKLTQYKEGVKVDIVNKDDYYREWVLSNRKEFFNYNQKTDEFLQKVYEVYNYTFNSNKQIGNCAVCKSEIISAVKQHYFNEI